MTSSRTTSVACLAVFCLSAGSLLAQTDYRTKTLSFKDHNPDAIVTVQSESTSNGQGSGGVEKEIDFADYDHDGDLDVAIAVARSDFGQRLNKLYRNDLNHPDPASRVMQEVSGTSVIPGFANLDTARCAFFADFDDDTWADIIIVCDVNSSGGPGRTKFYHNESDGMGGRRFVELFGVLNNPNGSACNGSYADFDQNGLLDFYMCNYPGFSQDSLMLNGINGDPAGLFTNVTGPNFPSATGYGVHSEPGDFNGDGTLDIIVGNRTNSSNYIYYNDNDSDPSGGDPSTGPGDFEYSDTGYRWLVPEQAQPSNVGEENGGFPGDFNNDGHTDFYWANNGTGVNFNYRDAIYRNTGINDSFNRAQFVKQDMPAALDTETYKVNRTDLDGDGKVDLIVMSELSSRRPYIYRNTSIEGGEISFIEWTPAWFTNTHRGWQCNCADLLDTDEDVDGRPDIFLGAMFNDYLFENTDSEIFEYDSLQNGELPAFHGAAPIAVAGMVAQGETKMLEALGSDIPAGADVSVLLRSPGDCDLTVTVGGNEIPHENRVGEDLDEAVQFTKAGGGSVMIEITGQSEGVLLGDLNGDNEFDFLDIQPFVDLLNSGEFDAAADMNQDCKIDFTDIQPFVDGLNGGKPQFSQSKFVIEFLSRT